MNIALAQINTQIGDFEQNVRRILESLQTAENQKADLVVFPELALTGYCPDDLLERPDFLAAHDRALKNIAQSVQNCRVLIGGIAKNKEPTGKPLFNAAFLISKEGILHVHSKRHLPTYDVFDERRYFEPGKTAGSFSLNGFSFGVSICEDLWFDAECLGRELYTQNSVEDPIYQKADFHLNLSASPYAQQKIEQRSALLVKTAKSLQKPVGYVNLVGGNDGLIFDGTSLWIDPNGEIKTQLESFSEDFGVVLSPRFASSLLIEEINDSSLVCKTAKQSLFKNPLGDLKDEYELSSLHQALVLGISDYLKKTGFKKVVLGLSGGIDSALVATLAVDACGAENVLGVLMPSPYSSGHSIKDAETLAQNLGIPYRKIRIDPLFQAYLKSLDLSVSPNNTVSLTLQNIQARIRGNLLMALSSEERALLLATGNKSELALGYCTLYGDLCGAIAPIGDLFKTDVYRLSYYLNRQNERIPHSTLTKAPSAELAPDQKDQDDLPPYETIDAILKDWIENQLSFAEIIEKGWDQKLVAALIARVGQNEYKRRQAPIILKVSAKCLGIGWKMPVTQTFAASF